LNVFIIEALQHYGYPALWLIIFVAAVGAPISGNLLLYAAGAFAAFGDFNVFILFPLSVSAAVLGDNLGYYIGHRVGVPLLAWFERQRRFRFITPERLAAGRAYFRRRTGWAIFLTRFLIVVLGGPINFLAGIDDYSYRNFLFWDVSGQLLGAVIPLGLGYAFAESWEEMANILGDFSGLLLALLVALVITAFFVRKIRQNRKARTAAADAGQNGAIAPTDPLPLVESQADAGQNGAIAPTDLLPLVESQADAGQNDALPSTEPLSLVESQTGHDSGHLPIPPVGEPS